MFSYELSCYFRNENKNNVKIRIFVFLSSIIMVSFGQFVLKPWFIRNIISNISIAHNGVNTFVSHLLIGLPSTLLNIALLIYFIKKGYYKSFIRIKNIKDTFFYGLVGGLFITFVIIIMWIIFGYNFKFNIPWCKSLGDIFSNFYEEISFRILIMLGILYLSRNKIVAVLGSSIFFGLIHQQYSMGMMILVIFAGIILSIVYLKTKNIVAPWLSHQISDMILDSILLL